MTDRIEVNKTYKTYIGGAFLRTESGRFYKVTGGDGSLVANACRCSRKDVRNAVVAARGAFEGWRNRSAYNRGQILYRIAEMLEGRKAQFTEELARLGAGSEDAGKEVRSAVDRLVYYAGWADKYQQVYSTVNPVASSHFNFSVPEPAGVVGILPPADSALLGLVSVVAPVITGGNSCVVPAAEQSPNVAVSFAEVLDSSDVPGGVVNILTGFRDELIPPLTSHMDVNAFLYTGGTLDTKTRKQIDENAALNVKRIVKYPAEAWDRPDSANPELIMNFQEIKTTWHPIGN